MTKRESKEGADEFEMRRRPTSQGTGRVSVTQGGEGGDKSGESWGWGRTMCARKGNQVNGGGQKNRQIERKKKEGRVDSDSDWDE